MSDELPSERHKRLVAFGFKEACVYCNCLLDGTIYHDCKKGKVKHLCLDLTRHLKEKSNV